MTEFLTLPSLARRSVVLLFLLLAATSAEAADAKQLARRFKIPRAVVPGFLEPRQDPATVAIGERLFLETRFSQYFFAHSGGDANAVLLAGDSVVDTTVTTNRPLPGPFAGHAINCRAWSRSIP